MIRTSIGILFITFLFVCWQPSSNARETNIQVFDSLSINICSQLFDSLKAKGINKLKLQINQSPASEYFKVRFVNLAKGNAVSIYETGSDNNYPTLNIALKSAGVIYANLSDTNDIYKRTVHLTVEYFIKSGSGELSPGQEIGMLRTDRICPQEIEFSNSKEYSFARSTPPAPETSLLEEIAMPLILVSSALLTVILLFTVRSA